jgi:hypothetical protein
VYSWFQSSVETNGAGGGGEGQKGSEGGGSGGKAREVAPGGRITAFLLRIRSCVLRRQNRRLFIK